MKVIDLLNKIANYEEMPLKIKVDFCEYRLANNNYWCDKTQRYLINDCCSTYDLNDEVEIIEEQYDNSIKSHIQLIQTYTDDERVLAQCNLILKELEDE